MTVPPDPMPRPDRSMLRAGTAEREQVARLLAEAHAEGRLADDEYMERAAAAHAAVTYADLDRLLTDLPVQQLAPRRPQQPTTRSPSQAPSLPESRTDREERQRQRRRDSLRGVWLAWAIASGVNLVIWVLVSMSAGELVYFWPMWVAGPWGAVLLATTIFGRGEDR